MLSLKLDAKIIKKMIKSQKNEDFCVRFKKNTDSDAF